MRRLSPNMTTGALTTVCAILLGLTPTAQGQACADTQVYIEPDNIRTNFLLGYENFKNKDWCGALPYFRWIVATEPMFVTQGEPDGRNYQFLASSYEGVANTIDDRDLRRAYLDSVLVVRTTMYETLDTQGIGYDERKRMLLDGQFYAKHFNEYPDEQGTVFDLYEEAFRMAPDSTDDFYLNALGRIVSGRASAEEVDPLEARAYVDELIGYADDPSYLESVRATFRVEPIEAWEDAYTAYLDGSEDEDVIKRVFVGTVQLDSLILERRPDIDLRTLRNDLLPAIADMNPTPDLLVYLGTVAVGQDRTDEGIEYFNRAIAMAEGNAEKLDLHYKIANTLYGAGRRSEAYQQAGKALELNSNYGPALYIRALVVSGTLKGGTLTNAAGAWCVADMFSRAAAAGGETAGRARQLAGRYAASGPTPESYFFEGWRPGMRVTGNTGYGSCTTTVR